MGVLSPGALARFTLGPAVFLVAAALLGYHLWMVGAETVHPLTNALDAHSGGILVLPAVAAGACIVGSRLAAAGAFGRLCSLSRRASLAAVAVVPAAVAGALALGVGAVAQTVRGGHLAGIPWWLAAVMLLSSVAAALLGALLGRVLPLFVALPVAMTCAYLAVGAFSAMDNGPLRLMLAPPVACCVSQVAPSPAAVGGHVLALLALVLVLGAVWAGVSARRSALAPAGALLLAAVASMMGGWAAASAAPEHGLVLRTPTGGCEKVSPDAVLSLCLWPENEPRRDRIAEEVSALAAVADQHDLPFPQQITEYAGTTGRVVALDGTNDDHWRASLLFAVAEAPRCERSQVLPSETAEAVATGVGDGAAGQELDAVSIEWWEVQLGRTPRLSPDAERRLGAHPAEQARVLQEHLAERQC